MAEDPAKGEPQSVTEPLIEPEIVGPTETVLTEPAADAAESGSSTEKRLSGFGHKLVLNAYSGMPSMLMFSSVADKPAEVRALITLDGSLLAVPLSFHMKTKSFVGTFPTPKQSLQYQFQVLLPEGRLAISELFTADPKCEKNVADEIAKSAASFPAQAGLLTEALELDKDSERLQYMINSIESVLKDK